MHLDLSDEEAAALTQELHSIVENDRYSISPRIRGTLKAILAKLRPEPVSNPPPLISRPMQHLGLTDEEVDALTQELLYIVETDRYPFSPRVQTLRAILHKLRPEPAPPKVYAPLVSAFRRRRGA